MSQFRQLAAKYTRSEPVVPLRIGLHIGEIFFEDAKALGDGVNVASRAQSLGQENTILISEDVHDKIKNNTSVMTTSLGHFDFKNVGKAMETFTPQSRTVCAAAEKDEREAKEKNLQKRNIVALDGLCS